MKALRGMKDILPPTNEKYLDFIDKAVSIAKKYRYEYIETPILEESSLFKRSVGESSDIVGKEMYEFKDKSGNLIALRPEGTAGVVRSFIENKFDRLQRKFRFFYYGPMFRYERPQKGRYREFHQFGCESFGEKSVFEDAEIILMTKEILDSFDIKYILKINSLGCEKCMPQYKKKILEFLDSKKEYLCKDCLRRKETNPMRALDCKEENCKKLYKKAPTVYDSLCKECKEDFDFLQDILNMMDIKFEVDLFLVRGLDYYTKTAFEFVADSLGAQDAIAGGGRFDRLIELLGGKSTPALGFAIGIERILDLIEEKHKPKAGFFAGSIDKEGLKEIFLISSKIRKKHLCYFEKEPKSLKALLKAGDKKGCRYVVVIGEEELKNKTVLIRDLKEKKQEILPIEEFLKRFE